MNKYRPEADEPIEVLKVDNSSVRKQQLAKLERTPRRSATRRPSRRRSRRSPRPPPGNGNLLALAVDAARAKATVGEISDALEKVFGRHEARIRTISGVYRQEAGADMSRIDEVRQACAAFAEEQGRRPRILVAKMGQDGHDRGQKVIATGFADLGLRRRRRPAVPDAGGGRPPGGRGRRPRRRGVARWRRAT